TTNLTPQEVDALFGSLRTIVDEGMSVVLITHKIRETMAACDVMTVMRDGKRVTTVARNETSPDALASLMVGETTANKEDLAIVTAEADPADMSSAAGEAEPYRPDGPTRVEIMG